jgi:peptidoglycan/LPS O-acetylase OafA/YrhL
MFVCSLLLIPLPVMTERYFNLFSFNAPAWSLFWEYIANIVYAFVLSRLRRIYLWILLVPSAVALCFTVYREGSLLGGWSGPTFWDGLIRVSYSFLAGMLLFRSGWIIKNRLGFAFLAVLLILAFLSPYSRFNFLLEPGIVLVYFPLLVALGAGAAPGPRLKRLCTLSGKISYPLYMTHYWALWIFADYYNKHKPEPRQLFFIVFASVVFLLLLAWLAMVAFDNPIRKRLSRKLLNTTSARSRSRHSVQS